MIAFNRIQGPPYYVEITIHMIASFFIASIRFLSYEFTRVALEVKCVWGSGRVQYASRNPCECSQEYRIGRAEEELITGCVICEFFFLRIYVFFYFLHWFSFSCITMVAVDLKLLPGSTSIELYGSAICLRKLIWNNEYNMMMSCHGSRCTCTPFCFLSFALIFLWIVLISSQLLIVYLVSWCSTPTLSFLHFPRLFCNIRVGFYYFEGCNAGALPFIIIYIAINHVEQWQHLTRPAKQLKDQ